MAHWESTAQADALELSQLLRTPNGTQTLRAIQAAGLVAADDVWGLLFAAAVGAGKTLESALLMQVIGGERPLVFVPASVLPQTNADYKALRMHWQFPNFYRLEAWEAISSDPTLLDDYKPTSIILDEVHKAKRRNESARARRLDRFVEENPDVPICALTATPQRSSAEDFIHLIWWTLKDRAAKLVPALDSPEFKEWVEQYDGSADFREAFCERLAQTRGVVVSTEVYNDVPLTIRQIVRTPPAELEEHFARLRDLAEAPDGWFLEGPAEAWTLARCLKQGFFYEHDPRPPEPYREGRKGWYSQVRKVKKKKRKIAGGPYDTEGEVMAGVRKGHLRADFLDAWLEVKDTYKPQTKTTWLSDWAINFAIEWGEARKVEGRRAIVWVEHIGFGEELAARTGWPYYREGALNAQKKHARHAKAPVIICSRSSCGTGCDGLQKTGYCCMLFVCPPPGNLELEQNIGREHRSEFVGDSVEVDILISCIEDVGSFAKSLVEADETRQGWGTPQKLHLATIVKGQIPSPETHSAWRAKAELLDLDELDLEHDEA